MTKKKVIAAMPISNTMSLNIYDVDEPEEYVEAGYNNDTPKQYPLGYDERGIYFDMDGDIHYLDEFMRIDGVRIV